MADNDQIPDVMNDDPIEIVAWVFGVSAAEMQVILDEEEARQAPIEVPRTLLALGPDADGKDVLATRLAGRTDVTAAQITDEARRRL